MLLIMQVPSQLLLLREPPKLWPLLIIVCLKGVMHVQGFDNPAVLWGFGFAQNQSTEEEQLAAQVRMPYLVH